MPALPSASSTRCNAPALSSKLTAITSVRLTASPAALRAALLALWDNPALVARLGTGARQRFGELFTAEKMVRAYVDLYREIS